MTGEDFNSFNIRWFGIPVLRSMPAHKVELNTIPYTTKAHEWVKYIGNDGKPCEPILMSTWVDYIYEDRITLNNIKIDSRKLSEIRDEKRIIEAETQISDLVNKIEELEPKLKDKE